MIKRFTILLLFAVATHAQGRSGQAPVAGKQNVLWQKLEASIGEVDKRLDGTMGVAIEDLTSGQTFFLNGDEIFPEASSIKVAILAELYHQSQQVGQGIQGKAGLNNLYTVRPSDLVADSDILSGLTPGVSSITNRDLATMVVAVSDNSAANILIDRVGMENVNSLLNSLGLKNTKLRRKMMDLKAAAEGRENISTPREMMTLLDGLYRGKILNAELTQDYFRLLSTHKESWIPRDLPADLQIANKPGALEGVRNDVGIVYAQNRPYIICVMTTYLSNERAGEDAITEISASAYRLFDRLGRASEYGRVSSPGNGAKP